MYIHIGVGFGVARSTVRAMPEPRKVGRVTGRFPRFFVSYSCEKIETDKCRESAWVCIFGFMYCKHCGKQIIDDSLYCCFCGCKQDSIKSISDSNDTNENLPIGIEEEQLEEYVQKEEKTITIPNWSYLGRRMIGTIIDKIAIFVICFIAILVIGSFDFDFFGELGVFSALFHMNTESIHSSAIGHVMANYPGDCISQHQLEINEYVSYLLRIELKIAYLFVLINIIYYFLLESTLGVSVGKYLFRLKLINSSTNTHQRISILKVTMRAIVLFVTASLIIGLRWLLGFNYYVAIVLFFLVFDFTVLLWNKSLVDMVTSTKLVYESISDSYSSNINNKSIVDEKQESNILYRRHKMTIGSNILRIGWCFFLIISLYTVHTILSYYFADYYNPNNYDTEDNSYYEKESNNYKRKYLIKNYYDYPDERFAMTYIINPSKSGGKWLDSKLGPLPQGHYMSTYAESGSDNYFFEYRRVKRYKNSYIRGEKVAYDDYESIYKKYTYSNAISSYDISDYVSLNERDDTKYDEYLSDIEKKLIDNHIEYIYSKEDGHKAIAYNTNNGKPIKRVVVCANDRAFLISSESTRELDNISSIFCSKISLNYHVRKSEYSKVNCAFIILIVLCVFIIWINVFTYIKSTVKNRYAYTLYWISLISLVVNIAIATIQSYALYSSLFASVSSVFVLMGSLLSIVCISTPLCIIYFKRSREPWKYDYIVPSFLKRSQYNTIKSDVYKKSYVYYICYPLMVLSLLPFGIYIVILYVIPLLLICQGIIWFNNWRKWVKESNS